MLLQMLCEERLFAAAKPKVWLRDSVKRALKNLSTATAQAWHESLDGNPFKR